MIYLLANLALIAYWPRHGWSGNPLTHVLVPVIGILTWIAPIHLALKPGEAPTRRGLALGDRDVVLGIVLLLCYVATGTRSHAFGYGHRWQNEGTSLEEAPAGRLRAHSGEA